MLQADANFQAANAKVVKTPIFKMTFADDAGSNVFINTDPVEEPDPVVDPIEGVYFVDFSTWTERNDSHNRWALLSDVEISVTGAKLDDSACFYRDFGANGVGGDFSCNFVLNLAASYRFAPFAITSILTDAGTDSSGDFRFYHGLALYVSYTNFILRVISSAQGYNTGSLSFSLNTDYYITIDFDADGGANGTGRLTATFRTGSHTGPVHGTLAQDCPANAVSAWRYAQAMTAVWNWGGGNPTTGTLKNLVMDFG